MTHTEHSDQTAPVRLTGLAALEYASRDRASHLMRATLFGVHAIELGEAYRWAQQTGGRGLYVDVPM